MNDCLLHIASLLAQVLVNGFWQGLVLILVVALTLGIFPLLDASARFTVWAGTFAAAILLPILHLPAHSAGFGSEPAGTIRLPAGWAVLITLFWTLAVIIRIADFFFQASRMRSIWRNAVPASIPTSVELLLKHLSSKLPRRPQICTSADVDAPCIIGFLSPRLLLPEWLVATLTESEYRQIVLHECEHLRRRDDWLNLIQKLTLAVFPLNPALLFADRRLSLERELACDASVIAATAAPFDYATCLTHLAEQRVVRRSHLALALSAWNQRTRRSELGVRVHRLLRPIGGMSTLQVRISLAFLTLTVAGGTIALARSPYFISFSIPRAPSLVGVSSASLSPVRFEQAQTIRGSRTVAVVFHPSTPAAKEPKVTKAFQRTLPGAARRANLLRSSSGPGPSTSSPVLRVFLTEDPRQTQKSDQAAKFVWTDFSPAYAAVPFADGWVILQL